MNETYPEGREFAGVIGRYTAESRAAWPVSPVPAERLRSVVMIVLDDLGFGQIGCFGGLGGRVRTPYLDRLAAGGLRYNNFHVSPMCSPTRAALLSGRNSHSVGVGRIMEASRGFPGYHCRIPRETALLPAALALHGYTCLAIGKWHLTPGEEITPIGPFDRWPLGLGFHRFYGFHGGAVDQWNPMVWEDNHCTGKPALTTEDYHLSEDLTDHAIRWIEEQQAVAPSRPYFLYLSFGAMHQPHHVSREWSDRYRGAFSAGWETVRVENLQRQKELGIVPPDTVLPPVNPGVPSWADLDRQTRLLMERQMEVYAGFLSHTDHQIGRLTDYLERRGTLADTLTMVLSDNGSSGEGGPYGRATVTTGFNGRPETREQTLSYLDDWGGPSNFPNYATGWAMAGNTPNRWYKQFAHEGGTRTPLIVHWPAAIAGRGEIRSQFHAASDVMPTILEAFGLAVPETIGGVTQRPLEGISFGYTFDDANARTRKASQYFEMFGHRAIWADGWKAVTAHWAPETEAMFFGAANPETAPGKFDEDQWELYHLDEDFSECHDLAARHPRILRRLTELWWSEAGRYQVLPLDDHMGFRMASTGGPPAGYKVFEERTEFSYFSPVELTPSVSPNVRNRSHVISVRCELPKKSRGGVLLSDGGPEGGYSLYVSDGIVYYVSNYLGRELTFASQPAGTVGELQIMLRFTKTGEHQGNARLSVNGVSAEPVAVSHTNPVRYDARSGGLRVGSDPGGVCGRYRVPFSFDGTILQICISCRGPEYVDENAELRMNLAEQ